MTQVKPNPPFHYAKPLVECQHPVIEKLRACSPRYVRGAQLAECGDDDCHARVVEAVPTGRTKVAADALDALAATTQAARR